MVSLTPPEDSTGAPAADVLPAAGLRPGDGFEARVERVAYGGDGVARPDGLTVFLPWTAPGDRVRATVTERHPRYGRARLDAVVTPGPDRAVPGCPVFGVCGGCRLQHLTAEAQRAAKAGAVTDALERIAARTLPAALHCESGAPAWHYRQRAVFSWRWDGAALQFGFHAAADPAAIVPILACPIFAVAGNDSLDALTRGLEVGLRRERVAHEGRLAVRVLPAGSGGDDTVVVQAGVFADAVGLARRLAGTCAEAAAIPATWGRWTPQGGPLTLATDAPRLAVRIPYRGLTLRVGLDSFLQADLGAAEHLYDAALDGLAAQPGERVVDGYAGVGVVTCQLAAGGVQVTAVESHPGAASDLRANGAAVGGAAVHVLQLPAERMDWAAPRPHAVLVNPPRGGCPPQALTSITRSSARRLVYVACDPTTLARDLQRLGPSWQLEGVRVFDCFPQTAHVETVAVLRRPS
ncbi:MAG: class I SAM-dependent RNA methyltransferase [Gemmatimonadota bacterium]